MSRLLRLPEYDSRQFRLSAAQAKRLNDTGFLSVVPGSESGSWRITASHHVGTLVIDDLHFYVRPKIRLENLFLLLSVGMREQDWRRSATQYAIDGDLLPAVISFFTRLVDGTFARGMYRSYREERDRLYGVRGRIDIRAQITRGGIVHPVDCSFGEFTADVDENRYLKAGVRLALRVPRVRHEDRRRLHRLMVALEEVSDVGVSPEDLDRIGFNRLNNHYEPALSLTRVLFENLTLKDQWGETVASSFMVDMNRLFERFITDRLERALRGRLQVKSQYGTHLDRAGRVHMRPDLVFRRRGYIAFVGDLKYKVAKEQRALSTSDQYQILAYTTALDLPEGILIYCREPGSESPQHDAFTVRHSNKVLHAWGVNMSGSASQIETELQNLAIWIAERAKRAVPLVRPSAS